MRFQKSKQFTIAEGMPKEIVIFESIVITDRNIRNDTDSVKYFYRRGYLRIFVVYIQKLTTKTIFFYG